MSAENGAKIKEEHDRQELRRRRFAFLDRRISELHALGKPDPSYDALGHISPRTGSVPGRLARRQADKEWAERLRAMKS